MPDKEPESLFNSGNAEGTPNPVAPTPTAPQVPDGTSTLDSLVGDGKKFKTAEDLARGKAASDAFIDSLQTQITEMREDLNKRAAIEDVLEEIRASREPAPVVPDVKDPDTGTPGVQLDDVKKLVESTINENNSLSEQRRNLTSVKEALVSQLGDDYESKVRAKLTELNLGEDFANGLAATQPRAFLQLMTGGASTGSTSPQPVSSVRTGTSFKVGNSYSDYQKLRETSPTEYFSSKVQMQMHKDATEQGDGFYTD